MSYNKELIKKFIRYYKPHKLLFMLDMLASLAMAGILLVYPFLTTKIIDDYIPAGMIDKIIILTGVLFVLYGIRAYLNYFVNYWGHVVGLRMEADMRDDLFKHMQKLSFKFFDNNRTGSLMSRMVNDLNLITELAHHGPEDLFISAIMLLGSFVILVQQEWRLAVPVYLLVIPIIIVFAITQRKKMSKAFKDVREKTGDINSHLENSISGIRVAKSYTNEEYEIEKFLAGNAEFRQSKNHAYKEMAFFQTGMVYFINFLSVMVLGLGGYFTYKGIITVGELTGFLLYMSYVMQPIRRLTDFTQQFEQGMNGFLRFDEIMQVKPDIVDGEVELKDTKGEININDICFHYNEDEIVLDNISLNMEKGKTVALVGPSGGGKSTLCHLIPRFYDVQSGEITIDGINVKDYTLKSLRKSIGVVQQGVFLFAGTIKENILYGKTDASQEEIEKAAKNANIHDFINGLPDGYETWIGERGVRLSGGQKQRISIARVFLKNPPILLLDEATSALDNETEMKIQQSLDKLLKGRTTLVIAHRLSTIRNADVIAVLSEDGIVEKGTHDELYAMEKGIYKRLYDAQFFAEKNILIQNELND